MTYDMDEYRVTWTKMVDKLPRGNGDGRVLFVKARRSADAIAIARDHIERKHGITRFSVDSADKAPEVPEGKVVEGEG